jgi:hypothetical protein
VLEPFLEVPCPFCIPAPLLECSPSIFHNLVGLALMPIFTKTKCGELW